MHLPDVQKQRRYLIAAALIATTAVLVGFHATTTYLSAVTLSDGASPKTSAVDVAPHPKSAPAVAVATARDEMPAASPEMPNPTGVAAAAKAKALAEMDELQDEAPEPAPKPRRRHRAPKVDLHKVY